VAGNIPRPQGSRSFWSEGVIPSRHRRRKDALKSNFSQACGCKFAEFTSYIEIRNSHDFVRSVGPCGTSTDFLRSIAPPSKGELTGGNLS